MTTFERELAELEHAGVRMVVDKRGEEWFGFVRIYKLPKPIKAMLWIIVGGPWAWFVLLDCG